MTWRCKGCNTPNIFWRNSCRSCGRPVRGYDNIVPPESDLARRLREVSDQIDEQERLTTPVFTPPLQPMLGDCGCPVYNICNSTACPRSPRITC